MKSYGKKIFIYIFCGLLTFSCVASSYYKTAHAIEWLGGALAFEEALKWTLALLGITATAGMTDAYWDQYGDEFTEYAIENGATQTEVAEWQLKLCEGVLDKASSVWDSFKTWASSLVSGSSGSDGSINIGLYDGITFGECLPVINNYFGTNFSISSSNSYYNEPVYTILINSNNPKFCFVFVQNETINLFHYTTYVFTPNNDSCKYYYGNEALSYSLANIGSRNGIGSPPFYLWGNYNVISDDITYIPILSSSNVGDSNFDSAFTSDISTTDVISSVLPDETDDEVALPMPGVSDSDNIASKDAYDEIIDAINDGTITHEQGLERIQEILKVIVYDTVTDDILPIQEDPDTGENKNKEDAINENKNNMGFTLAGLENVFPFCIPFDIYAFMTLLVAEPEAPEVDFPIKSINGEVEEIHIDLAPFDSVAVVVRYIFDFLFIIGLGILTRSLIGGGSSD